MFEIQQKNRREIQGLHLLFLFHQYFFPQLTLLPYSLSPSDYLQILEVNKPLGS